MALTIANDGVYLGSGKVQNGTGSDYFSVTTGDLLVVVSASGRYTHSVSALYTTLEEQLSVDGKLKISAGLAPITDYEEHLVFSLGGSYDEFGFRLYILNGVTFGSVGAAIGGTGSGSTATNNATMSAFTAEGSSGILIAGAVDRNHLGAPTSSDLNEWAFSTTRADGYDISCLFGSKTIGDGPQTFNADAATTNAADWDWAAIEVIGVPLRQKSQVTNATLAASVRASRW